MAHSHQDEKTQEKLRLQGADDTHLFQKADREKNVLETRTLLERKPRDFKGRAEK